MQGSRPGADELDQGYREAQRAAILEVYPDARIYCPRELMVEWLLDRADELRAAHGALADTPHVERTDHDPGVQILVRTFWALCRLAGDVNVLVAYLPNHEASMGTAVEMHSAHLRGRPVVAITEMRQNLAILSLASVITPDMDGFRALLASGWLERERVVPLTPDPDDYRPAADPPPAAARAISVAELAEILREHQPGKIPPAAPLRAETTFEELGITSQDLVEVIFAIEDRLDVELVPADTGSPATLGELADFANGVASTAGAR